MTLEKQQWRALKCGLLMALCLALTACTTSRINKQAAARLDQLRTGSVTPALRADAENELGYAMRTDKVLHGLKTENEKLVAAPSHVASLQELLDAAVQHNGTIASAGNKVGRATVDRLNALFGFAPSLNATYTINKLNEKVISSDNVVFDQGQANYPFMTANLTLDQPLFDLSRVYGFQSSEAAKSKAEADYMAALAEVSHEVFENYLTAVQSQARKQSINEQQAFLDRQVAGENSLERSGLGDVARTASLRSSHADLAAEEALEAADYTDALTNLARLTGLNISQIAPFKFPQKLLGSERDIDLEKSIAASLKNSPVMISSRLNVAIANTRRRQAWAEDYAPKVNGFITFADEDRDASRFGGASHTQDLTFGLKLTVPLFNPRGAGYAGVAADMDVGAAATDYYSTSRQLETKLRATYGRMGELTRALTALEVSVKQASTAYRAERAKLENGETVDLAVASRQLNLAKTIEKRAYYRAEYLRSWGELQFLMGKSLFLEKF